MEVTDIRVSKCKKEGSIKAFVSFTLDGSFAVRGARIMARNDGGLFLAYPSRERNGEYEDLCCPVTKELSAKISKAVIEEYNHPMRKNDEERMEQAMMLTEETMENEKTKEPAKVTKGRAR